ncbi:MAG: hypothetical protein ACR2HG_04135 [Pyrinomonadaceae bacterium]
MEIQKSKESTVDLNADLADLVRSARINQIKFRFNLPYPPNPRSKISAFYSNFEFPNNFLKLDFLIIEKIKSDLIFNSRETK